FFASEYIERFDILIELIKHSKPLFSLVVRVLVKYSVVVAAVLDMVHYCLFGRQIMSLLDSKCFHQVYHSRRTAWYLFAVACVPNTIHFGALVLEQIPLYLQKPITVYSTISIAFLYIQCTNFNFIVYLLLYHQYAIKKLLE